MTKPSLEIIVPCGQNSDLFLYHYVKTALETWSGNTDLTFSVGINNWPQFDQGILDFAKTFANVKMKVVNTDTEPGSVGHGLVLQSLYDDVASDYCVVADCDIVMLQKDWDTTMLSHLDEKTVIMGTEYYAHSNLPKYLGFPCLIVAMFKTTLVTEHSLSFMPHPNKGAHTILTPEEALAYGRPQGSQVYLDTGYEFPLKLRNKGFQGHCLTFTKPMVLGTGQEFHYKGRPFLSHMKGSSVTPANHPNAQLWLEQAERWNTKTLQKNRVIP